VGIRDLLVNGPLGFGTAPLGNMFRDIPDHEAAATVDAAWNHGTRFFDTAPMYGAGLAEIRLARYLAQHDRDDYVLSTKVGRLVLDEVDTDERDTEMFKFGRANRVVYDYTEKGALKSIEGSLNRLGVDRLDFVFVHDPAQDFHGDAWLAQLETARTGAFRALTRLRDEGVPRQGSALLLVKRGPNAGARFSLDRPTTTAGRHPDSDIFLDDITVSRRHAQFRCVSGEFQVVDIGSLNGTYVNRELVDSAVLANGDMVQIGKFRLLFLIGANTRRQ
jgi:Aldo/keto reductase family/FHA domain